jgi:hypothetical protein
MILPYLLTFRYNLKINILEWTWDNEKLSLEEKANRITFGLSYYSYILPLIFSFIGIPLINSSILSSEMKNYS